MAEWGKLYGSLHGSPEWRAATKAARALWTTALSWCIDQEGQDGDVPAHMLRTLEGTLTEAQCLVDVRLWDAIDGGWHIRNYERRQRTKEKIDADREAAAERKRKSRESHRDSQRDARVTPAVSHGGSHASRGEESRGEEKEQQQSSAVADATPDLPPESRPDVDKILDHLDDRLRTNGLKVPARIQRNATAARLLLDRDGYTLDQVLWIVDWATADEFWRTNIRSASKLREKFETLKAQATTKGHRKGTEPARPSRDQWLDR